MADEIKTTKYQVFNYWKDKGITPDGEVVPLSEPRHDVEPVVIDLGEPECWGCGMQLFAETKLYLKALQEEDFETIWNKCTFDIQRAHILGRFLGGSDDPENLFLLCPHCHKISPDIKNKKAFLGWIYKSRHGENWRVKFSNDVAVFLEEQFHFTEEEFEEYYHLMLENYDEIVKEQGNYMYSNVGVHFNDVADSSLAYACAEYIAKKVRGELDN